MDILEEHVLDLGLLAHSAVALGVILVLALAGRIVARTLRQPEVIGEIVFGLLSGPVVIALLGRDTFETVLPDPVFDLIKLASQAGLVLFLVGLAHRLGTDHGRPPRRGMAWVAAGSLVPPLVTGLLLAGLVLLTDDDAARGGAPLPAFLLMVAVAMSITAVPVMARILADRGMSRPTAGRMALGSAIFIDAVGRLLLTLAISLGKGSLADSLHSVRALAFGAVCAPAVRYGLRTRAAQDACRRMTAILGAALVGLAIPQDEGAPWERTVASVTRAGSALAPAFFVVTGVTVLTGSFADTSWPLIASAVVLGCLGKGLGAYLGARRGGRPRETARTIAVLMNTRGLTELIVLQAGFSSGILTGPMVLALIVMALVTTAMTGPLLTLLDRGRNRRATGTPTCPGSPAAPGSPAGPGTPTASGPPAASGPPVEATESGVR
ncbi:cation:proton antiporter [Streptomyces luteocolor]|uniref:cation:proton antiporter n=1 Tax=Streptomyces luteocolor TaxID=285500 RepID=UPI000853AAA1|nr:cation:proton antiporter [Streptomyces luteocolor]